MTGDGPRGVKLLKSVNGFFCGGRSFLHHGEPVNGLKGNPFLVERLELVNCFFCGRKSCVHHGEPAGPTRPFKTPARKTGKGKRLD